MLFFLPQAGKRDTKKKFPKPFERDEGRQGDHERGAGDGVRYDDSHKHSSGSRRSDELNSSQGNFLNVKLELSQLLYMAVICACTDVNNTVRSVHPPSGGPREFSQKLLE